MKRKNGYRNGFIFAILSSVLIACTSSTENHRVPNSSAPVLQTGASSPSNGFENNIFTIKNRFTPPKGYQRIPVSEHSFAYYLRHLPLYPPSRKVQYYDGSIKPNQTATAAVIKIDVGNRDLQQCADAVMRLRAEYLYALKKYDAIHFNFTNGFRADYDKWRQGWRIKVQGNKVEWQKTAASSNSYTDFRKYLTQVFIYAGTLSLDKELASIPIKDIEIGDVFIQGGSPGHAVIVVDMVQHSQTQEKLFLLAQSYMPAQDIHVLSNPNKKESAWYSIPIKTLHTPEWTFDTNDLHRF